MRPKKPASRKRKKTRCPRMLRIIPYTRVFKTYAPSFRIPNQRLVLLRPAILFRAARVRIVSQ